MTTVPINGPVIALHQFPQCFAQVDEARHEDLTAYALSHTNKAQLRKFTDDSNNNNNNNNNTPGRYVIISLALTAAFYLSAIW